VKRTLLSVVVVLALVYVLGFAFDLLNAGDDLAVAAGVAVILAEVAVAVAFAKRITKGVVHVAE
jgi:hypothetical protein